MSERKRRLRGVMPRIDSRLLYVDEVRCRGSDLFRAVCARNLEGIVAKRAMVGTRATACRRPG